MGRLKGTKSEVEKKGKARVEYKHELSIKGGVNPTGNLESRDKRTSVFPVAPILRASSNSFFHISLLLYIPSFIISLTLQAISDTIQTADEEMSPILLLLIWAMVALNGTKSLPHSSHPHRHHHHHYHHQYHHYYHQKHHHLALSGDHCHTPKHDSAVYNCTKLGLAESKCPSRAVGIPSVTQTPLGIPGIIHNRGVASSSIAGNASSSISVFAPSPESAAKRSWINDAINKLQGCDPISLEGETCPSKSWKVLLVGFLLFIVGLLLLCILVRLAFIVSRQLKQKFRKYRERREAEEAKKWNIPLRAAAANRDTFQLSPARPISNNEILTIPEASG